MKNPLRNLLVMCRTWRKLRRHRGAFTLADAALQWPRVLLPDRWHFRAAGEALRRQAHIEPVGNDVFRIELKGRGLCFFWRGQPTDHLWYVIEQEFDPRNAHCYTTPPIALAAESLVLDVGACEGLFACRVAQAGLARRVICFEPDPQMAALIRRGADENGVGPKITVEALAVCDRSGRVGYQAGADALSGKVQWNGPAQTTVEAVSLDDYCRARGLNLTPRDLIKVDAEGMDADVLRGAERLIRAGCPQLAVTTYHCEQHCFEIPAWLKQVQPNYRFRLKGFAYWTARPRPILLQAAA
jgi:FkbM family methyltransferase